MGFLTPAASGEKDVLRTYVLQQLAQIRTTVTGLTDEQARSTPSASTMNLTGLLLHCGLVAVGWATLAVAGEDQEPEFPDDLTNRTMDVCMADARPLAEILDEFDRCVAGTAERIDALTDLSRPVPVPDAPWFPKDLESWETRWVLGHLVAELGRHAGHADIIRESIDGKGAYELNDLADAGSV